MPWIFQHRTLDASIRLKSLLEQDSILKVPGVFNALVGMLAKQMGFKTLYISGAAFSAAKGFPDLGYHTIHDLTSFVRNVYRACNLPLIVDADTGFGRALQIPQMVMELEEAGAAAIQIEDQDLPKKCGHLENKKLVSTEEMCHKIKAAVKVRKNILIAARTDAYSVYGIKEAINRVNQYISAGADIIFPEALKTEEEFRAFAAEVKVPLLANMTEFGKTPYYTAQQFRQWGYKIVIYPVSTLRASMKGAESVLKDIKNKGTQKDVLHKMQTRSELYDLLDYNEYDEFEQKLDTSHSDIMQ